MSCSLLAVFLLIIEQPLEKLANKTTATTTKSARPIRFRMMESPFDLVGSGPTTLPDRRRERFIYAGESTAHDPRRADLTLCKYPGARSPKPTAPRWGTHPARKKTAPRSARGAEQIQNERVSLAKTTC